MKIEPIEYLVTFDDGEEFIITHCRIGKNSWMIKVADNETYTLDVYGNWVIQCESLFRNMFNYSEALEALKKWKEKQDAP